MKKKADEFLKIKQDVLKRQAYGNAQTMMFETLVRASAIKYMADHISDKFR